MRVEWSLQANADLENIFDYILQHDPIKAQAVLDKIKNTTEHLKIHPRIGKPGRVSGTRELIITDFPYVLPYIETPDSLVIIRVLHTAMNWP